MIIPDDILDKLEEIFKIIATDWIIIEKEENEL